VAATAAVGVVVVVAGLVVIAAGVVGAHGVTMMARRGRGRGARTAIAVVAAAIAVTGASAVAATSVMGTTATGITLFGGILRGGTFHFHPFALQDVLLVVTHATVDCLLIFEGDEAEASVFTGFFFKHDDGILDFTIAKEIVLKFFFMKRGR